jgi:hypothetical protein
MAGAMFGVVFAVALVIAFFSLVPHEMLEGQWPLGISPAEVQRYATVADLRRVEARMAEAQGEPFYFGGAARGADCLQAQHNAQWTTRWFEAQGYGDSVQVRPLSGMPGSFEVRFKEEAPFRAMQAMVLSPATPESIGLKYAQITATELELATPDLEAVRLVSCGREMGAYLAEEVFTTAALARRRITEAVLFTRSFDPDRPDQVFPQVFGDTAQAGLLRAMLALMMEDAARDRLDKLAHTLDEQAAAGVLLMHWLEGAPDPLYQENTFAFQWNRGRITPLHRPARIAAEVPATTPGPWATNVLTPWLKVPAFRDTFDERRKVIRGREQELLKAFAAADSVWIPVMAGNAPMAEVTAAAERLKQGMLQRLHEGDALAFLDRPMIPVPGAATLMRGQEVAKRHWPTGSESDAVRALAVRYKARLLGDSLIFPRGKYSIDQDIVMPQGYTLVLLSGARITMGAGRSIICQGPLHVRGTKINPVFIRAGGAPFGTLAVVGDGDTQVSVSGLQMSGGIGARMDGVQHTGMITIRDAANTAFTNCIISAPSGDVAVFVEGGSLALDDCTFITSRLELRDVVGTIARSVFQGGARGAGAGGVLANASRLAVTDCRFWGIDRAAFEAGEGTRAVLRNNSISQCTVGVAATDLAELHLVGGGITGNKTGLRAERTRPLYGGARILLYGTDLARNATERTVDEHSTISDGGRFDERVQEEMVRR